jgi:hypothetical protein
MAFEPTGRGQVSIDIYQQNYTLSSSLLLLLLLLFFFFSRLAKVRHGQLRLE